MLGFQDMAVGYAFSLLGDFHLAEDAAQDAFLAAFQELDSLRQPGAFVPWLRTVVGKHCDRIRRRRRPTEALETDAERLVVDSPSPLDVIGRDAVAGLVGRAIASLPANERDVVTLYYIGEQSGRQVAAFLDVPLTTVKKRRGLPSHAFDDEASWLRRGFALGWRALQWQVLVTDLPVAEVPELERFEATHRDDLAAVYNATTRRLTGTVRRPIYRRNKHPGHFSTYSWRGADGGTAGYVSGSPGPGEACFWVDEVAGEADTCLAVLRAIAEAEQCTELYFDRLHYKSAVGVRLRQTGSCRLFTGTKSAKARWYVARIVNLKSLVTKLAPMLHERLLASGLADWRGSLSICLECEGASEVVTLVAQDGGMAVRDGAVGPNAISGDQAVTQLLLGCEEADEVVAVNGIEVCGDAARILPVLFPAQYPQMENQAL